MPSVNARRAYTCRALRDDVPHSSKVTTVEGQPGSSGGGSVCVIDDANQEQIAQAAALVLARAKAVLNEKLEDYESEIQQLENAASRNFVYRSVADGHRSRLPVRCPQIWRQPLPDYIRQE